MFQGIAVRLHRRLTYRRVLLLLSPTATITMSCLFEAAKTNHHELDSVSLHQQTKWAWWRKRYSTTLHEYRVPGEDDATLKSHHQSAISPSENQEDPRPDPTCTYRRRAAYNPNRRPSASLCSRYVRYVPQGRII